jgi:hypothetical protein
MVEYLHSPVMADNREGNDQRRSVMCDALTDLFKLRLARNSASAQQKYARRSQSAYA